MNTRDRLKETCTMSITLPAYVREIAYAGGYAALKDYFADHEDWFGWSLRDCCRLYLRPMTLGQIAVRIVNNAAPEDCSPYDYPDFASEMKGTGTAWETWEEASFWNAFKDWHTGSEDQFTKDDVKAMRALAKAAWNLDGKEACAQGKRLAKAWSVGRPHKWETGFPLSRRERISRPKYSMERRMSRAQLMK